MFKHLQVGWSTPSQPAGPHSSQADASTTILWRRFEDRFARKIGQDEEVSDSKIFKLQKGTKGLPHTNHVWAHQIC
jgi:hypothetical protein